jgi:hypothetical protein
MPFGWHLVDRPREWPGVHTVRALLEGEILEGLWFDRTKEYLPVVDESLKSLLLGGAGSGGVSGWSVRARTPEVGIGNSGWIW